MQLQDYLDNKKITQTEFAEKLEVTSMSISHYCRGSRMPNKKMMAKIFLETKGEVSPNDFYNIKTSE